MDQESTQQLRTWFTEHVSRQNLLRSLSLVLFLLHRCKYGAKKCPKNHVRFDFWDDSTLVNQKTGKTIEKPFDGASAEPTMCFFYSTCHSSSRAYSIIYGISFISCLACFLSYCCALYFYRKFRLQCKQGYKMCCMCLDPSMFVYQLLFFLKLKLMTLLFCRFYDCLMEYFFLFC